MKVIPIGGTLFCGSTLLQFILGGLDDVFVAGEINNIFTNTDNIKCSMCKGDCKFWTRAFIKKCAKEKSHTYDLIRDKAIKKFGTELIVNIDKDPVVIRGHKECGNQVDGVIVLFKCPEAYVYSAMTHKLSDNLKVLANGYSEVYKQFLNDYDNGTYDKVVFVNYSSLAKKTVTVIRRICKEFGLKYKNGIKDFWENNDIHPLGGNTAVYMRMWDDDKINAILNSDYWKNTYTDSHTDEIVNHCYRIKYDSRWKKGLSKKEKSVVWGCTEAMETYDKMLEIAVV